jgi:hypothetical protein
MLVRKAPIVVNGTMLDQETKAMGCAAATLLVRRGGHKGHETSHS